MSPCSTYRGAADIVLTLAGISQSEKEDGENLPEAKSEKKERKKDKAAGCLACLSLLWSRVKILET